VLPGAFLDIGLFRGLFGHHARNSAEIEGKMQRLRLGGSVAIRAAFGARRLETAERMDY
jgi:hypothetical protein